MNRIAKNERWWFYILAIFIVGLLSLNLVVIVCQQAKISDLLEEMQQARKDAIDEINKYRKED